MGLKTFFRLELPPETFKRLDFVIEQDYKPMLAIGAANIFKNPELVKGDDDDDEESDE